MKWLWSQKPVSFAMSEISLSVVVRSFRAGRRCRISLAFVSDDGTQTNAAYTTYCQLSKGSFGQARVLTVPTDSSWWTQLTRPMDMHIEMAWLNVALTYACVSNLTDGVYYKGIYPFDGPVRETGVLHLDKAFAGPGSKKVVRLFGGDNKYFDKVFHGGGVTVIVRSSQIDRLMRNNV